MARSYSIASITQSGGVGTPGRVRLAAADGNVVSSFQGKFYRDSSGATLPGYTASPPASYSLIQATTFTISGNTSYNGSYTVYSPVSAGDTNAPSLFTGTQTEILVNENIGAPITAGDDLNTGTVSNISTYLLKITGEADLIVPPTVILSNRPMDIVGRNGTPWGESFAQNFLELAQNSAAASAPSNPFLGQTWYDIANNEFKLNGNGGWVTLASGAAGSNHVPLVGSVWHNVDGEPQPRSDGSVHRTRSSVHRHRRWRVQDDPPVGHHVRLVEPDYDRVHGI
jgi:hypothetical protein